MPLAQKPWKRQSMPNGEIHVFPTFGQEHQLEGLNCWCHPEQDLEFEQLVIHQVAN